MSLTMNLKSNPFILIIISIYKLKISRSKVIYMIETQGKCLKILHFNDVYDIEENKSVAGATAEEESK